MPCIDKVVESSADLITVFWALNQRRKKNALFACRQSKHGLLGHKSVLLRVTVPCLWAACLVLVFCSWRLSRAAPVESERASMAVVEAI